MKLSKTLVTALLALVIVPSATLTSLRAPSSVSAAPSRAGSTITLLVGAGGAPFFQQEAAAFHQVHPDLTVTFKTEADDVYASAVARDIAVNNAPDLVWSPDPRPLVKDNLLASLQPYVKKYNWTKKIPSSVLGPGRENAQGRLGSGTLYQFEGNAGPAIGVFYNRQLAKKVGLTTPPRTLAQFQQILAKAKSHHITPIIVANKDGILEQVHNLLLGQYMGAKGLNKFIYDAPGGSITTSAAVKATTLLQKWIKAGYFNADANSVDQTTSYGLFAAGKGLFTIQGNWMDPFLDKSSLKGKYGFFPLPPKTAGGSYTGSHYDAFPLSIPAKSAHKAAAAAFLNFLLTKQAKQVALANGYEVASKGVKAPASLSAPLSKQLAAGYSLVAKGNGFHGWLFQGSPTMGTLWAPELQLLFAGRETPAAMLSKLQAAYNKDLGR